MTLDCEAIPSELLSGAHSIEKIILTEKVTSIADHAFDNLINLTSINIPNRITSIGKGTFSYCKSLTTIDLHEGITSIGDDAFYECSSLTEITIPNSVTYIGESAFWGCTNLTSLNIPQSVTSLGLHVIDICFAMTDLYVYHTTPLAIEDETLFLPLPSEQKLTIHVPTGCKEAYMAAPYWKDFSKIVDDITSTGIASITTDDEDDQIFDIKGNRIDNLQHGLNIIKKKNGQVVKILK